MAIPRTSGTKVTLYEIATGQRIQRWPVDAREMLARGGYSLTPPGEQPVEDEEAALRVAPPAEAQRFDAALITEESNVSPIGAPLNVVREGVTVNAGEAVATPMSKRVK